MDLNELTYRIEGECDDPIARLRREVVIVTDMGDVFVPVRVASDGELLIINCRKDRQEGEA